MCPGILVALPSHATDICSFRSNSLPIGYKDVHLGIPGDHVCRGLVHRWYRKMRPFRKCSKLYGRTVLGRAIMFRVSKGSHIRREGTLMFLLV